MNKISEDCADLIIRNEIIEQYQNENKDNITPINNKHSTLHLSLIDFDKCALGKYNYNFFQLVFS